MKYLVSLSFLLLFSNLGFAAEQSIGKVILSMGETVAISEDGNSRSLKRKSEIFPSDLLKTGPKGRLQIRFTDDSRLSLKPNTEFKISEYQFESSSPEEGKAVYELIKGGMRTLTGKIGKENKENYRVDTVVATIGIRGTDYSIDLLPGKLDGQVNQGAISVNSKDSSQNVDAGQSFSLDAATGAIQVFATPLPSTQDEQSDQDSSSGSDEEEKEEESSDQSDSSSDSESADSTESSDNSETADNPESTDSESSDSTSQTTGTEGTTDTSSLTSGGTDDSSSTTIDSSLAEISNTYTGVTSVVETNQEPLITNTSSPNPTGSGTPADSNSLTAVAMTEIDPDKGIRAGSGAVPVGELTSITIDNTAGTGDIVTGINYIDTSSSANIDSCSPCIFSSPSTTSSLRELNNTTINGSQVTWGRWNSGFTVIENGVTQNNLGSFHFMFTDDLTSDAQIANVAATKSGAYLYTYTSSGKLTSPEIETGALGSLVDFDTSGAPTGQLYNGTYVLVDWDTQTIDQVSIMANVSDGSGTRSYHMTQKSTGNSLDSVLKGGNLTLEGTCSGGKCTQSSVDTTLSGNMSFDFVGDSAEAAITSYGASGTNYDGDNVSVAGTVLLDDGGAAP